MSLSKAVCSYCKTSTVGSAQVDYYGAMTPVRQMANVSAPEASLLVIQPYDKSMIPAIERSIMQSDLALTPNSDGNVIRLNIPQLTAVRWRSLSGVQAGMFIVWQSYLHGQALKVLQLDWGCCLSPN